MNRSKPLDMKENKFHLPDRQRLLLFRAVAILLGLTIALIAAEAVLRLTKFNPGQVNVGYMQFGYETGRPSFDEDGVQKEIVNYRLRLFQPDSELLWRTIPNTPFTNSQGFRNSRDFALKKGAGTFRILFIGDSCMFLGDQVYPELIEKSLAGHPEWQRIECINASVPGYSSFQGGKLLQQLTPYQPDLIVASFGWNDHWQAQGGLTDQQQYSLSRGSRLASLVRAVAAGYLKQPVERVPLAEFASNLQIICKTAKTGGAQILLITAPSGFLEKSMPEWAFRFFGSSYHMSQEEVTKIPGKHHAYADVVRSTAAKSGAWLVDAEQEFGKKGLTVSNGFRDDLIHFRRPGHQRMAELVTETIIEKFRSIPAGK